MVKHRGVSIKNMFLKEIEELIETDPTFKYSSKGDFVNTAVREKLEEHHRLKIKPQD